MPLIEIYRSTKAGCEHRAFVLRAVGIGSEIVPFEGAFALFVEAGAAAIAQDQLERYYAENSRPIQTMRLPSMQDNAWLAPTIFAFVLVLTAFLAGRDFFGFDWYGAGALTNAIQLRHEWWRTITALTLHIDHQHLLSNIGFGALFSFAIARLVGSGITLLCTFVAAILGNFLDSVLMPASHVSIGASTIVFATLGLVSAYSWRIQWSGRLRWAHRWAPLVVGVMLLGFLGANGENTDVLAHITGFLFGGLFGVLLTHIPPRAVASRALQLACAATAIGLLILGWMLALP